MPPRYFTLEEANKLIPEISPLISDLLERRARVAQAQKRIPHIIENIYDNVGNPLATQIAHEFVIMEELLTQIKSYGCEVKNLNIGLIDFLATRDGREVYLCWRYGEPRIEYYHELHTGFNGRRPIE